MPAHDHLHRRHARAYALSDLDAEEVAALRIRDALPDPQPQGPETLVSIVYMTAPKTFPGEVAGWSTQGVTGPTPTDQNVEVTPTPTPEPTPETESSAALVVDTSSPTTKHTPSPTEQTAQETSTDLPLSIEPPSSSVTAGAGLVAATTTIANAVTSSTVGPAASSTATAGSNASGGMGTGGKAGLAIGILCLVGTIAALIFFCVRKRRNAAARQQLDDEKNEEFGGAGRHTSMQTTVTAPRLSLRPMAQFLPSLGDKRQSRGNTLALGNTSNTTRTYVPSRDPPPVGGQDANRSNPFGNHAETIDTANVSGPPIVNEISPKGEVIATTVASAAAAGAAAGLARGASKRDHGPKTVDLTTKGPLLNPPSPSGTEFSASSESAATPTPTGSAAAIAAAGGPANTAVHRVQLDFKPSMEDELELRAGQLIRILHEYDDGWALCIRLDRSRQGVVPRTCLSVRPVKPRPQQNGSRGPPPAGIHLPSQQGRPMSPGMNQGPRSASPSMAHGRPMSPAMNQGRPMSPAGSRPMTPNGSQYSPQQPIPSNQGRPRSPSAAQMQDRRNSPPGPGPMNPASSPSSPAPSSPPGGEIGRKPVPGQAM